MKRRVKAGVREGAGPPPGYQWTVAYLTLAEDDAREFLDDGQYAHVVDQIRALAREEDPSHPLTVSVAAVEDFLELREKGGPLGRINVRVFFFLDKSNRTIVVLGAFKKEADGSTPNATKRTMARRKRKYLRGEFDSP